ncbi:MAG: C_GCAxxG_C_C family protein [Oscillospiraceae bacterium]|nr:C_GCAxxG_C_C family protein [Oscillospiraceae bacterium]
MADERVEKLLMQGIDCCQTVFSCFAEEIGLTQEEAQKLAAGFGSGMFTGETCGAVVGAIMVLGKKYGHTAPVDDEVRAKMVEKVKDFKCRFKERRGTCICSQLLGYDMSTDEGQDEAWESGTMQSRCPEIMTDAVEILDDMFDEE